MPFVPDDANVTMGPPGVSTRTPGSSRFAPGSIIAGRYRLIALLGKGGMGEVYRAEDLTLDQQVALKFLPDRGDRDDPAALAQFHDELPIARQVSHRNVCRLYDIGEADGRRFLTMEYVDGEDLASLLRRIGRIPQDKAIAIKRQIWAGLAAAHDRGVLHRDLKPANVMLDGDGNIRITDFGLAVASTDSTATPAGTPQHIAPEQLAGAPASIKSDVYALGLVLFEIFTGRRAYEAKTLQELRELHDAGIIVTPSSVIREIEPAVERVILRCLERVPERRPGSVLAIAAGLPGGDPLAEALAAGETPSPALVVAAAEREALTAVAADGAFAGLGLWISYLAFEPYCRRFWPEMLLGWSRLLSGHVRDPRIGRDLLAGLAAGVVWLLIDFARRLVPQALGYAPILSRLGGELTFTGTADAVRLWSILAVRALLPAFTTVMLFVVLRLLTRRPSAAIAIGMGAIFVWWSSFGAAPVFWSEAVAEVLVVAIFTFVMIRFGLLAALMALFVSSVLQVVPLTLQVGHGSATGSNQTIGLLVALTLFAFYASRAGQPLFGTIAE